MTIEEKDALIKHQEEVIKLYEELCTDIRLKLYALEDTVIAGDMKLRIKEGDKDAKKTGDISED